MERSQTKKAVQARKWRNSARDQRRLNKVINRYIFHKHRSIYDECNELFIALKEKYPTLGDKCDLTKTRMFRRLVEDTDSSDNGENTIKTAPTSTAGLLANATETEFPSTAGHIATATETEFPSTTGHITITTETESPSTTGHITITTETEPPLTAPHNATEPVQPEFIPVRHLHVGFNAYGQIMDQLTDEGEYVNMNNVNNEEFENIIRELERDESIQQLLNDIEMQPLEDEPDADEGIGLNAENEDDELDYNVQFDF